MSNFSSRVPLPPPTNSVRSITFPFSTLLILLISGGIFSMATPLCSGCSGHGSPSNYTEDGPDVCLNHNPRGVAKSPRKKTVRRYTPRSDPFQVTPAHIKLFLSCYVFLRSRSCPPLTVHIPKQATITRSRTRSSRSLSMTLEWETGYGRGSTFVFSTLDLWECKR